MPLSPTMAVTNVLLSFGLESPQPFASLAFGKSKVTQTEQSEACGDCDNRHSAARVQAQHVRMKVCGRVKRELLLGFCCFGRAPPCPPQKENLRRFCVLCFRFRSWELTSFRMTICLAAKPR